MKATDALRDVNSALLGVLITLAQLQAVSNLILQANNEGRDLSEDEQKQVRDVRNAARAAAEAAVA